MRRPNAAIINADDFGLDARTNRTIIAGFERGLLSSATLMANTAGFEEACGLIARHGLEGRVGLHFNITHGPALGQKARRQPRLCKAEGLFEPGLPRASLALPGDLQNAIGEELELQWERCLAYGLRPTHIDSHQHVHNLWPIGKLVAKFAATRGVPVRLARNLGRNIGPLKRCYKWGLNTRIRSRCGTPVDWACTPRDLLDGFRPQGLIEIITHPVLLGAGDMGDDYLPEGASLEALVDDVLAGFERISYGQAVQR